MSEVAKRLQVQLDHINDLIREQNRMLIAEIEPTSSEREDMTSLVASTLRTVKSTPHHGLQEAIDKFNVVLPELAGLGYNIKPYSISFEELTAPPPPAKKHVRFDPELNERNERNELIEEPQIQTPAENDFSSAQIFQQNNYIYEDQDRRLEELSSNINRQRNLGEGINNELDVHNNLLDDLESQTERSQGRLDRLTHGVHTFNRKSRECGVCSIIMALVLILFIVLLI